jgi:ankyrin repeat protein
MGLRMHTRHGAKWVVALLAVGVIALTDTVRTADSLVAEAARAGDVTAVRDLIAGGEDVNETQVDGSTALLWAAYHADALMVDTLIAAGADVNAANRYGVTPLLQASRAGNVPVMEALLNAGADPSLAHPEGETPLMGVARTGNVEAIRLLMARGADVNHADEFQQQTPMMWAAAEGHVEAVNALLEAGADPDLKARETVLVERSHADHPTGGFTALMWAVRNGHVDVVDTLAANGADLNLTNGDGVTAMSIAIINDRLDLAAHLLDLGADANDGSLFFTADMHDMTLDARARDGSRLRANHPNELTTLDLMQRLLDAGADPNKPFVGRVHSTSMGTGENYNGTAMYRAATASDVEALKVLLAAGSDLAWTPSRPEGAAGGGRGGNFGTPALLAAINGGNGYAFGGGPGFGRLGPPPWREAGSREPADALAVMLAAGADPNSKTPDGEYAIHRAVEEKSLSMIRQLAEAGADLMARNSDGDLAIDVAMELPDSEVDPTGMADPNRYIKPTDNKDDIVAELRTLMGLGPNDPIPAAPEAETPAEDATDEAAETAENEVGA